MMEIIHVLLYIYSYMHIMHNLKIEYSCLGTPSAANILNLLVSRWQ